MDETRAREILGVGPHAGPRELRRAYRLRSKATHPDLAGSDEAFNDVQEAHAFLRDRVRDSHTPWWIEAEDIPRGRVAKEEEPPRQSRFERMFREALRREDSY